MIQVCSSWVDRSLSIKGRVTIFNTLITSLIQYILTNTITPQMGVAEVRKIATSFIWAGKKAKIAYSTLIQPISNGGLKVMDLSCRIRVSYLGWIKRILNDRNSTSAEFVNGMMEGADLEVLLGAKRSLPVFSQPVSPFYVQMIQQCMEVHDFPDNEDDIGGSCFGITVASLLPETLLWLANGGGGSKQGSS